MLIPEVPLGIGLRHFVPQFSHLNHSFPGKKALEWSWERRLAISETNDHTFQVNGCNQGAGVTATWLKISTLPWPSPYDPGK